MAHHSTYYGVNVWRDMRAGHYLRWEAYVDGEFVRADTLDGIRELVRECLRVNR